jgi:hypothetical protein
MEGVYDVCLKPLDDGMVFRELNQDLISNVIVVGVWPDWVLH